jgi:hypothetical protein
MIQFKNVKLAGVSFGDCQKHIHNWGWKEFGNYDLIREPDNPYDANCIGVYAGGHHLGYLPKDMAAGLAPQMDTGKEYKAGFVCRNEHPYGGYIGLTVDIYEVV